MNLINRLVAVTIFLAVLIGLIAFARGYRLDLSKKSVTATGILAISSTPKAAKIYINGELKGVTDMNITLPPNNYQIDIKKDGYTSWSKKVNLKGELVISLDSLLFPLNPSLSPLTNLGVVAAVPADQTDKILLFSQNNDEVRDGVYLFETTKNPLSLLRPLKLLILKKELPADIDFTSPTVYFSPDYKQGVLEFSNTKKTTLAFLISFDEENKNLFDITASKSTLLDAWAKEKEKAHFKILETFPPEFTKIASDSFKIVSFSPNETKILYQAKHPLTIPLIINPPLIATNQTPETRNLKKDGLYVYDKKEDKNYEIVIPASSFQLPASILWYPDSKHFVFSESPSSAEATAGKKKISIIDYDGSNKQTIYSGPFDEPFFTTTSDGALLVLINLNPETNKFPDLYSVGIR